MHIPIGDYLIEVLDHRGQPIPSSIRIFATQDDAVTTAPHIAQALGAMRWRVMQCVADSLTPHPIPVGSANRNPAHR